LTGFWGRIKKTGEMTGFFMPELTVYFFAIYFFRVFFFTVYGAVY